MTGDCLSEIITSRESERAAEDGHNVSLSCNYSGVVYNLLWYRQYPGFKPEVLLTITESGSTVKVDPSAHWFSAKVEKQNKLLKLEISPVHVTDSAVYYCALEPTVTGNTLLLHKCGNHV
ncbi:hypothetical protein DNTS_029950 [Danionella cerebrum]|uniref:Ig-like domain-containing protein n=1 Tax=Danionella cerebrum TaxID=2873325 RepID=A0A553RQ17_9TELE|nr:hypothetical protein DNTS_029950 [Danionella translucida]